MNKVPSLARIQELQKKLGGSMLVGNSTVILEGNSEIIEKLTQQIQEVTQEMSSDPCYMQLMEAFDNKFAGEELFYSN